MRFQSQKNDFRTISNEEMAFKMVKMAKYGHFEYVVEYPIWVSIKRYLTGKLALACQNWIYCISFLENVQKPFETEFFRIQLFFEVFGRFLLNGCSKSNFECFGPFSSNRTK